MTDPIPIVVSACLLGENVRYDGGHKLAPFLIRSFGNIVRWIPVCPEVGCGLTVPREPMVLMGNPDAPRLKGASTGDDYTERMTRWMNTRLAELEPRGPCGYVCKKNSPSCSAIGRIEVMDEAGRIAGRGSGIFTKAFAERFPLVPVEDDGSLQDPAVRERFLEKIIARATR